MQVPTGDGGQLQGVAAQMQQQITELARAIGELREVRFTLFAQGSALPEWCAWPAF